MIKPEIKAQIDSKAIGLLRIDKLVSVITSIYEFFEFMAIIIPEIDKYENIANG